MATGIRGLTPDIQDEITLLDRSTVAWFGTGTYEFVRILKYLFNRSVFTTKFTIFRSLYRRRK